MINDADNTEFVQMLTIISDALEQSLSSEIQINLEKLSNDGYNDKINQKTSFFKIWEKSYFEEALELVLNGTYARKSSRLAEKLSISSLITQFDWINQYEHRITDHDINQEVKIALIRMITQIKYTKQEKDLELFEQFDVLWRDLYQDKHSIMEKAYQ